MQSHLFVSEVSVQEWIDSMGALHVLGTVILFTVIGIACAYAIGIVVAKTLSR